MISKQLKQKMINHRHYLHAHPELGHQEYITQKYIINQLDLMKISYQTYHTSTIADLIIDPSYQTVALRADIDGLQIEELNDIEYKSQHPGIMHACGHDVHTAIQLGVIGYLVENKQLLKVNVRFIFQCDEEDFGGAKELCEQGYLNDIDAIFGLHVSNDIPMGSIGYVYGQMYAGGDDFELEVIGKQSHAAYPHLGSDSIVASCAIVQAAQQIISRMVDPLDSTTINFGTIDGMGTANTVCDLVKLSGTIRNLNPNTREVIIKQFFKQAKLIANAYNCQLKYTHNPSYPPLVNNKDCLDYVIANSEKLGYRAIDQQKPELGLEDFAYYLELVPGAFFNLGTCIAGDYRNIHSSTFQIDESALEIGANIQILNILNYQNLNN